jgi:hypothetical protein
MLETALGFLFEAGTVRPFAGLPGEHGLVLPFEKKRLIETGVGESVIQMGTGLTHKGSLNRRSSSQCI